MKVSIIIPVYNVAPYVEECIRSVMNQTMTEGVECIIVDDCGQDNSMEIVERMVAEYDGNIDFRILHHECNRGLSAARNTGIDAARGEYIYFLDSDDWLYAHSIESFNEILNIYPKVDVIQGLIVSDNNDINNWTHSDIALNCPLYTDNKERCRHLFQSNTLCMMMQNLLLRTSFIKENKLYCKEGIIHEDALWTIVMGEYINSYAFNNKDTYFYRTRTESIMSNMDVRKSVISLDVIICEILYRLKPNKSFQDELNFAIDMALLADKRARNNHIVINHKQKNILFKILFYICKNSSSGSYWYSFFSKIYKIELQLKSLLSTKKC